MILATKSENIIRTATIESCQNKTILIGKKMSGKNRVFREKWKEWKMIRELVPFFFILRNFVIKATLLSFGLWSVLWISGVIYGSFYYGLIPLQTYHLPLNFNFEPCPMSEDKDRCSFLKVTTWISFFLTKNNPFLFCTSLGWIRLWRGKNALKHGCLSDSRTEIFN